MKNKNILIFCLIFIAHIHGAANNQTTLQWLGNCVSTAINGAKNAVGMRDEGYCVDEEQGTPQLYLELAVQDELAFGTKSEKKIPAYERLLLIKDYSDQLDRANKRAYYDWQYLKPNIQLNNADFIERVGKVNIINLSPLLALSMKKFLETEHIKRHGKLTEKTPIYQLNESQHGYLEWCMRQLPEEELNSEDLEIIIENTQRAITINSTWESISRWVSKKMPTVEECKSFLVPEQEIKKSQAIYQNFAARVLLAAKIGQTSGARAKKNEVAALFEQPEFSKVYDQVWFRHCALATVLSDLIIKGPSIDVCTIYQHHWQNISPMFTTLIADIIISKKQPQKNLLPQKFIEMHQQAEAPIEKCIFLFCTSLNSEQRTLLLENRTSISQQIESNSDSEKIALNIHAIIKDCATNPHQRKLLILIAKHKRVTDIFKNIDKEMLMDQSQAISKFDASSSASAAASSSTNTPATSSQAFLNSLNLQQRVALLEKKETILSAPAERIATVIHDAIEADEVQLKLLAEIHSNNAIQDLFTTLASSDKESSKEDQSPDSLTSITTFNDTDDMN